MPCEHYGQKADHALIFMFQSYAANFSQPIAVFTSKGPVKGYILAQLVIKAICLLENSGALVDGLVSDGASTNRKLWKKFGVSGKLEESKNFFMHPLNDKRKVYVFSDAPHLIKTVRNRLHNNKYLKVLSNSMANALEFYRNRKCISLQGSEETQDC